jgi:hypothetical protein
MVIYIFLQNQPVHSGFEIIFYHELNNAVLLRIFTSYFTSKVAVHILPICAYNPYLLTLLDYKFTSSTATS